MGEDTPVKPDGCQLAVELLRYKAMDADKRAGANRERAAELEAEAQSLRAEAYQFSERSAALEQVVSKLMRERMGLS